MKNDALRLMTNYKLLSGYALASSRRRPKEPTTEIVGEEDIQNCRCVGSAILEGRADWLAFRHRKTGRYYFQLRPW